MIVEMYVSFRKVRSCFCSDLYWVVEYRVRVRWMMDECRVTVDIRCFCLIYEIKSIVR